MNERTSIVIAGAGFAGLAAAYELYSSGFSVTVLEARQRVGGRVWSELLPNGARIELGAEWISSADDTVIKMAEHLNLSLVQLGVDYRIRSVINGPAVSPVEQRKSHQIARAALAGMDRPMLSSSTIGEFLDNLPLDQPQKALLWSRLQGAFGKDLHQVALRMLGDYSLGEGGSFYRVATGNQSLAIAMAELLPDVRLGYKVTTINHHPDGVSIMGQAESGLFEIKAGAVVLALPIVRLASLNFNPALPQATAKAIFSVPMGVAAKLAVGTRNAPSLRALQDVEMPYWCWAGNGRGDDQRESPRCALTAFCGSEQAQENLATKSYDPSVWYNKVREANPDLDFVGNPVMVDWSQDEWALGCYAAFDNRATDLIPFLSRPVGRLFFAGEHTAVESGLMEGALASGIRAARQIVEARIL